MAFISWDDSLKVNIKTIDNQHQSLIGIINKLHDGMMARKGKEVMGDVLNSLVDYTQVHFRTEEKLFQTYSYPEAQNHKQKHAELETKALDIKKRHESGEIMLGIELMNFLKDWLTNHIKGEDRKYTAFFNAKGVF